MKKQFITNSAPTPTKLCEKLADASWQGFSIVAVCFNPQPPMTDPDAHWVAFLEMETGSESGTSL